MSEHPRFLTVDQVTDLHRLALEAHGGSEGLRDKAGLEAAVMHPQNIYLYGQEDLYEIAAGYIFHIAEAQAFIDGNKRAAVMAAFVFLESNNAPIRFDSMLLYSCIIQIAKSELDRAGLAETLKDLNDV